MFSPSFAAARPSLSSVYHNLPPGARGKPPPAHGSASIRTAPGNHCPRSPGTAPSAGPPVTRPTTICRSARHIAFRPFFTCRTQHRCFGVEPPPIVNIYLRLRAAHRFSFVFHAPQAAPSFRSLLSAVPRGASHGSFARAVGACAFTEAPRRGTSNRVFSRVPRGRAPRGFVRHGGFACVAGLSRAPRGLLHVPWGRAPRGFPACAAMHRKSKAEPEKSGSAWS